MKGFICVCVMCKCGECRKAKRIDRERIYPGTKTWLGRAIYIAKRNLRAGKLVWIERYEETE